VAGVLFLAAAIGPKVPMPSTEAASFFSADQEQRAKAVYVAGSLEELIKMANNAVASGDLSPEEFAKCFSSEKINSSDGIEAAEVVNLRFLSEHLKAAFIAVVPLALVLIISLVAIARERILNSDIAVLGLLFTIFGMFALNLGMSGGITAISSQAGRSLGMAYRQTILTGETLVVEGVDDHSLVTVPGEDGPETYIWIPGEKGPHLEKFVPSRLSGSSYTHVPVGSTASISFNIIIGYITILAVIFFLGFFAIFAEPALAVTAVTVEEMTIGTFKRRKLIMLAAIGVGGGMVIGFARILFSNMLPSGGIHLSWILAPCYALALLLTIFAPEDFSSIAWDVAGIATGPITVPIIITAGMGLGRDSLRSDGAFGIVAIASVFPIIAILVSGIIDMAKSKRALRRGYGE